MREVLSARIDLGKNTKTKIEREGHDRFVLKSGLTRQTGCKPTANKHTTEVHSNEMLWGNDMWSEHTLNRRVLLWNIFEKI